MDRIRDLQYTDAELCEIRDGVAEGKQPDFIVDTQGVLRYGSRLCVPNVPGLEEEILGETHSSQLSIHLGSTKMYRDLRQTFWWIGLERDVADYVARCLTCQQVKTEHQRPSGLLQPLPIPEWKWERIGMDFVVGLPRAPRGYDTVWVIVDRLTRSAHFLLVRTDYSFGEVAQIYVDEIVRLHGVPVSIFRIAVADSFHDSGGASRRRWTPSYISAPRIILRQMDRLRGPIRF